MARTPVTRIGKVQFFENHTSPWNTNATALGTSTSAVTALTTKTTAARAAFNAQVTAKQAAETATNVYNEAVKAMNDAGQAIIKIIDATVQSTGNVNLYNLAQLPAPATPTSSGNPGTPRNFAATFGNVGQLLLNWKNSNATGCTYNIYRRLGATGNFETLGGVGDKKFTDDTVPAGTTQVQYQIQAVRSTGVSDFGLFTVFLGIENGSPALTLGTPAKLAA